MSEVAAKPVRLHPGPLPLRIAKSQADRVEAILANCQRSGVADMTVREVCQAYENIWQSALFPNQAEARLAALEAAERVECDRENKRRCRVTGQVVKVYRLPLKQAELV